MQISHLGKGRRETLETRLEEQKPWKPGRPGALLLYGMPLEVRDLGEYLFSKFDNLLIYCKGKLQLQDFKFFLQHYFSQLPGFITLRQPSQDFVVFCETAQVAFCILQWSYPRKRTLLLVSHMSPAKEKKVIPKSTAHNHRNIIVTLVWSSYRYNLLPNRQGGVSGFGVAPASRRPRDQGNHGDGWGGWGRGHRLGNDWATKLACFCKN